VLARIQEVFTAGFTPTGFPKFTNAVSKAYASYQAGSTAGSCFSSETTDYDQLMWFTNTNDNLLTL